MSGRKMSINARENVDPESEISVILVKVSISLESEFDPEGSKSSGLGDQGAKKKNCLSMGTGSAFKFKKLLNILEHV